MLVSLAKLIPGPIGFIADAWGVVKGATIGIFTWLGAHPWAIAGLAFVALGGYHLYDHHELSGKLAKVQGQYSALVAKDNAARAQALAIEKQTDTVNTQRKDTADATLPPIEKSDLARADDYARAHRVRPAASQSGTSSVPSPGAVPPVDNGPGDPPDLVVIPHADLDTCTVNTDRLANAHDWALSRALTTPIQ